MTTELKKVQVVSLFKGIIENVELLDALATQEKVIEDELVKVILKLQAVQAMSEMAGQVAQANSLLAEIMENMTPEEIITFKAIVSQELGEKEELVVVGTMLVAVTGGAF